MIGQLTDMVTRHTNRFDDIDQRFGAVERHIGDSAAELVGRTTVQRIARHTS